MKDFIDSAAMWADPAVTRYIGGKPFTREESWSRLLRYAGHWSLFGFGYWVVEEKQTGKFIGEAGFADYKREVEPSLEGMPEIGWAFTSSAQGRGYATEAVRAVIAWGDSHFGPVRTGCIIHPENVASVRVATKCGYRESCVAIYKAKPVLMFVRDCIDIQ